MNTRYVKHYSCTYENANQCPKIDDILGYVKQRYTYLISASAFQMTLYIVYFIGKYV